MSLDFFFNSNGLWSAYEFFESGPLPNACLLFSFFWKDTTWGSDFVKTYDTYFSINGNLMLINEFNFHWLKAIEKYQVEKNMVTFAFEQATTHGLNVARTRAFNDESMRHCKLILVEIMNKLFRSHPWSLGYIKQSIPSLIFFSDFCIWRLVMSY